MRSLQDRLGKELLFFDGAMGTLLQKAGLKTGELPETLNLTNPALIRSIHVDYLKAGCHIVTSNTFGANALKFENDAQIVRAGIRLAGQAAREYGGYAALDLGPTGHLLKPLGDLPFEEAYDLYRRQVMAGREDADLILIETMGDLYEIKAALLAAKENSDLPVAVSMIFSDNGRLLTGADVRTAVLTVTSLGADIIGFNCGFGPDRMLPLIREAAQVTDRLIMVNPNAGLPEVINGITVYNVSAEDFAAKSVEAVQCGASLIGGCCGTTPAYTAAQVRACAGLRPLERTVCPPTAVTSYSSSVSFDRRTVLIGERINPTGKKRLKEALRAHDLNYILGEGVKQADCGADILDVNVGLPEIDETELLTSAVTELQAVTDRPLQLDTSSPEALESALRLYNGKPMINSVNGKKESMETVFPLAAKYGGLVVCLLLDEDGIPPTADGRIAVAKKLIRTAAAYGIGKHDLIFDALAMTVSTDPDAALVTLETTERLTRELGVKTVLGVSNISFGLPERETVTASFFTLAMRAGLSAGIINPCSEKMMTAYRAYNALSGLDSGFADYIAHAAPSAAREQPSSGTARSLCDCILCGLKEDAAACAAVELQTRDPLDIIDNDIIRALNIAGDGFEKKTVFLPQLLMCADAAKSVFEVLKNAMPAGQKGGKGRIIIATVKNDIHDIGKNIVRTLLENYGFDCIDLGKDVPVEVITQTAVRENIKLVALSALMTTTVPFMEETIRALRKVSDCKVVVGGAVLTQAYADSIGADHYAPDAMDTVRYAQKVFGVS